MWLQEQAQEEEEEKKEKEKQEKEKKEPVLPLELDDEAVSYTHLTLPTIYSV